MTSLRESPLLAGRAGRLASFSVLYAGAHVLALQLVDIRAAVNPALPSTGVMLAALLLSPRRDWPLLWLATGAIAAALTTSLADLSAVEIGGLIAINLVQTGLTAGLVVRACGGTPDLGRVRDVAALLFTTALVNGLTAVAVLLPFLGDPAVPLAVMFRNRWIGHTCAALLVTPWLVTWSGLAPAGFWRNERRVLEAAALAGLTVMQTWFAFGPGAAQLQLFPSPYMGVIPVAWAALRFGPAGVTAITATLAFVIFATLDLPDGLLAPVPLATRLAMVHLHVGILGTAGLFLAASARERTTAAQRAREAEHRIRAMFDGTPNAVALFRDGRLELANPAFGRMHGNKGAGELAGLTPADFVAPVDRSRFATWMNEPGGPTDRPRLLAVRGLHAGDRDFPMSVSHVRLEGEAPGNLLVTHRDLSDELRAQLELARLNRALRAIIACNRALVRDTTEDEMLREVCREIARSEGFKLAWVGWVEHDQGRTVRPVAQAGFETGCLEQARISWGDNLHGRGPCGRSVRTAAPVVCRDTATDPEYAPWREEAVARGYRSLVSLPLTDQGRVFGVLSLYSAEPDAFDQAEVRLLQDMADSMVFGILARRARARHREAEAQVLRLLTEAEQGRHALLGLLEDQRLAEEARAQSELKFTKVFQDAPVMILISDLTKGTVIDVNAEALRVGGLTREEVIGRTTLELGLLTPADRARLVGLLRTDGRFSGISMSFTRRDGRTVHGLLTGELLEFEGQTRLLTVMVDITDRRRAEESLGVAIERLSLALRASGLGVWQHNLKTRESEWDARVFAIFGHPPAKEPPPFDLILAQVAAEDQGRVQRSWNPPASCDRAYAIRFRILRPDGAVRHIELHGIVYDDASGRPERVIGVAGDITEIVEGSIEAERLRTQLLQAQKMETLGQMAAGVAHDFNNLLTGINGFVELASSSLPPGHEAAGLLDQARRGAGSARELVRRILNYSRSGREQGRVPLNLTEVVRDTAPLVAATLPPNVSLAIEAGREPAMVEADAGQMQQVLLNLCTNGAHAIGAAAGRIRVMVAVDERRLDPPAPGMPGPLVRLTVQDNGSGMDAATRQRVFEPFFTTKKAGEGTGLGLPIVRDIVANHGGTVEIESAPGAGTAVHIVLPYVRRSTPAARPVPNLPGRPRGRGQRVLVIDDDPAVLVVVRLSLQRAGYQPETFASAADGLRRLDSGGAPFDLLLVDQNMPDLDGAMVILRARAGFPTLPVIMMSGRFDGRDTPETLGAAGIRALRKPFEMADLLTLVEQTLRGG